MVKKKIKDLTLEEIINICKYKHCLNCPLHIDSIDECAMNDFATLDDDKLNKEVEIL